MYCSFQISTDLQSTVLDEQTKSNLSGLSSGLACTSRCELGCMGLRNCERNHVCGLLHSRHASLSQEAATMSGKRGIEADGNVCFDGASPLVSNPSPSSKAAAPRQINGAVPLPACASLLPEAAACS